MPRTGKGEGEQRNPLILIGAPPCTVFSSMQKITAKHNIGEAWEEKYTQGLSMLEFAISMYWDQIERGRFFLHEHLANATSWSLPQIQELERHPGVQVVIGDMCRWGMKVASEERNEDAAKLVKKPTKWMTNSPLLAKLLQARCSGDHEHQCLERSNLTKKAASYPIPLVKSILGVVRQLKRNKVDANLSKDPVHLMIPEMFQQWEDHITVSCGRKTISNFDIAPPIPVSWESVVVRRTIDRRTGVIMAEEALCNLDHKKRQRQFQGESPKEILTVFFSWNDDPLVARVCALEVPSPRDTYQSITSELLQRYSSDKHLLPKSTYRKARSSDDYLWGTYFRGRKW